MMKKKVYTVLASAIGILMLFGSCNDDRGQIPASPALTEFKTPGVVSVRFPSSTKLQTVVYNIDNIKKLIYNPTPYPYQSKFDSAYISMAVSTESGVKITNELTQKSVNWSVRDTNKIDVSGGKLLIEISRKGFDPIVYKMRLQTYGYDPTKLTWTKTTSSLPTASEDGHIFVHKGDKYWLTRLNTNSELYLVRDLSKGDFAKVQSALPQDLRPKTLVCDKKDGAWILDKMGNLYTSTDLKKWDKISADGIAFTGILYDITPEESAPSALSVIGYRSQDPSTYYTYEVSLGGIEQKSQLDPTMPVRNSYIYVYETAGQSNANIIGGVDKSGNVVTANHFTSDGLRWGQMPYSGKGFSTPKDGALYLRLDNSIFIVGGINSDGQAENKMYKSADRGRTWIELAKEQKPGEEFTPRTGVSGWIEGDEESPRFYLLGGLVNGTPSKEYWQGFLDTTGGIINSIAQ